MPARLQARSRDHHVDVATAVRERARRAVADDDSDRDVHCPCGDDGPPASLLARGASQLTNDPVRLADGRPFGQTAQQYPSQDPHKVLTAIARVADRARAPSAST